MVAPLVGAWIEIYHGLHYCSTRAIVAPLVGAWIEISVATIPDKLISVAPLVGAWIEILHLRLFLHDIALSLPSWERGLK